MNTHILLGHTLSYSGNPLREGWQDTSHINTEGAVAITDGHIARVGSAAELRGAFPTAQVHDYSGHLILPGLIDAHVHYPQTAMIASWGKRLIDWLNTYTFPEEMRLADPDYARTIAGRFCDLALAHGTTTVASFCTTAPISAQALFEAAKTRGMRVIAGKTCMDRNAPAGLIDTATRAYDDSKSLLETWHGQGRCVYAITPRFAPTSTPEQLSALGALWAEHPDALMQTHLSEQIEEIAWVKELFPKSTDYLDVYEGHGLIGPRAIFGHAIHLTARERDQIAATEAALVHCPTSNTFIGSGLFDTVGLANQGINIGLATDIGGGSSFSMLRTMAAAYEVAQLKGHALHAAQLLWMATTGSARALHQEAKIGALKQGYEADICVLDLHSTPAIAQRTAQAKSIWDAIFATIMMGDDRAIKSTWVAGRRVAKSTKP